MMGRGHVFMRRAHAERAGHAWRGRGMCGAAVGCRLASGDVELVGGTSESGGAHPDQVGSV